MTGEGFGYPPPGGAPAQGERTDGGWAAPSTATLPPMSGGVPPTHTQQFPVYPPEPPRKRGRAGLAAGMVALALVSGGVGGATGAYLASNHNGSSVTLGQTGNTAPAVKAEPGTIQAVAEKVLPSVVTIEVAGNQVEGEGTGIVLNADGLILTNNHVASAAGKKAQINVVFSDGSKSAATLVGADPVSDIAVIRVDKTGLTPITVGSSGNLVVGQQVVAVGSPLGLDGTVTTGIISSLDRPVSTSGESNNQNSVIDAIQTDAAINPGNSGGPLVDMNGALIGVNTAIATLGSSQGSQTGSIGLGFSIPVDQAMRVARQLIDTGKATHAMIGVQVPMKDDAEGARVTAVTAGGAAAAAGIPKGAIITKVDNRVITDGSALIAAIRSHSPGDKVQVTYTDPAGGSKTVTVTLTEAPAGS
ncbi:S1C family serine protease [Smaragdicoccus niigatensis]|uniref:S1C family serine protease n=1 Tax=Smaragdicoccus niigatensis TaxID=359359 RepID=UPI00036B7DDF|nr:trypsin-like peptidase domain-containing protein [Smaragdicoccus niigatensis]